MKKGHTFNQLILFMTIIILTSYATDIFAQPITQRHAKTPSFTQAQPGTPLRDGGDTVDDALIIESLPFTDTGNTCGASDDYDAVCYEPSTSPDLVYQFTPAADMIVDIDLCGSSYDTKVFLLDHELGQVACSDDTYYGAGHPCGTFNAALEFIALEEGVLYYIVIDGWGGECGDYELLIEETIPCDILCPDGGVDENETPMSGQYDQYNAGCFSDWSAPMDYILPTPGIDVFYLCGDNGFYVIPEGGGYDHDWWEVIVGSGEEVIVTLTAQRTTNLLQLSLPDGDCNASVIIQETFNDPCGSASLQILGEPGSSVYFWVHTIYNEYPNGEYPYYVEVIGGAVAVEQRSWSQVKALYK